MVNQLSKLEDLMLNKFERFCKEDKKIEKKMMRKMQRKKKRMMKF